MKVIPYLVVILLSLAGMIALYAWGDIRVSFTEEQANSQLGQTLPIVRGVNGKSATIEDINVDFYDGYFRVSADYILVYQERSVGGVIVADADPKYSSGAIYLRNLDILEHTLSELKIDETDGALVRELKSTLLNRLGVNENVVDDWLEANRGTIEGAALQLVSSTVRSVLNNTPVYDLTEQDMYQAFAAWFVTDVEVTDGMMTVVISPFNLILKVILHIVIGIMSVVIAIGMLMALAK